MYNSIMSETECEFGCECDIVPGSTDTVFELDSYQIEQKLQDKISRARQYLQVRAQQDDPREQSR